jgi:PKD repeat protein
MKKLLIILLVFTLCVIIAPAQATCVSFKACVPGTDVINVTNSQLSITHGNDPPIGNETQCTQYSSEHPNVVGHINVSGTDHSIECIGGTGQYCYQGSYLIDGQKYLAAGIVDLTSFNVTNITYTGQSRDNTLVYWASESSHQLRINDYIRTGAAVYTVDLCGEPTTVCGSGVIPLPGYTSPPTDPDGDCIYEDLNGNGRLDFADVVLYFNQMEWIAANEPVNAFDLNGNERIDFADIVQLFGEI